MRKNWFFFFSIFLFVGAIGVYYTFFMKPDDLKNIQSFEQCVAAGYSILETYPAQCKTSDGKTFTEDIGNEMQLSDSIKITSPRPNQYLMSPVKITGEARGTWFFEGVAPIKLVDESGNVIAQGLITAIPITNTSVPTSSAKRLIKNATESAEATPTSLNSYKGAGWMTTEFVPFTGELTFSNPTSPKATLIVEKDNPSGLPENEQQLSIPVYLK